MNILFFVQPGANSRSIFMDMLHGAEQLGHRCFNLELGPIWQLYSRVPAEKKIAAMREVTTSVGAFIRDNQIALSLSMWANATYSLLNPQNEGRPISIFHALQHPHLMMWLDAPERAHNGAARNDFSRGIFNSPYLFHWINNEGSARDMREIFNMGGPNNVLTHSYGIHPLVFQPAAQERREFDLVFSGGGGDLLAPTPIMLQEMARDQPDLLRIRQDLAQSAAPQLVALSRRLADAGAAPAAGNALVERLMQMQLADRTQPMLDRLNIIRREDAPLAAAVQALAGNPVLFTDVAAALRSIENFERAFVFSWLSRFFNCALFGSVDYSAWGCKVKSLGFVPYEQQAAVYSRGKVGLSVMRWQDEIGLHIKPFEITASGAACLAEDRPGLSDLFIPGREIVTFSSCSEAQTTLRELLDNPHRLQALTEAGSARTLKDHTWPVCMKYLITRIGQTLGRW